MTLRRLLLPLAVALGLGATSCTESPETAQTAEKPEDTTQAETARMIKRYSIERYSLPLEWTLSSCRQDHISSWNGVSVFAVEAWKFPTTISPNDVIAFCRTSSVRYSAFAIQDSIPTAYISACFGSGNPEVYPCKKGTRLSIGLDNPVSDANATGSTLDLEIKEIFHSGQVYLDAKIVK